MDSKEVIKHYRKSLKQAHITVGDLQNNLDFQSRILNSIRQQLLINTDWDGSFQKGENLATIVEKVIKHGPRFNADVCREKCPPFPNI